ncbi:MAG TPA: hypothetical protein VFI02_06055 [Armatimonadota bacterium]|nr:hypothetical protein [Armatimonadota bacterium]
MLEMLDTGCSIPHGKTADGPGWTRMSLQSEICTAGASVPICRENLQSEIAPLALGLQFFQGHYGVTLHYLMAVSLIVMSPCLILFFLAQKYFISGIALTGIKG